MSNELADVTPIIGRRFVSASNNVCTVRGLAEGAMQAFWQKEPSTDDILEFDKWATAVVGADSFYSTKGGTSDQIQAKYDKWIKELGCE